ncbi:ZIP family metal transporter [Candidatus Woesearchaeota archaeon]|nr:ZIP family metal transporter [Candidatus Woesearchaeota archaeon]
MDLRFIITIIIIALFQIFGGVLAWFILKKFRKYNRYALLAEMFLMLLVIFELVREGFAISYSVVLSVAAGLGLIALINKVIPHKNDKLGRLSYLVFIAMLMHELPEGLAFGSSYVINPSLGIIIAILIGLHNIPEGWIVALPYLINKKTRSAFKALFLTQLSFIIGGLITYLLLINLSEIIQAYFMTFAAGMMLFVVIEEAVLLKKKR